MKKPYAIIRLQKRKDRGSITRSNKHNHRIGPQKANINPNGPRPTILAGVADAPAELKARTPPKRRKDAVLAMEFVLTASPEWFAKATPEEYTAWKAKNVTWIQQELGDNFVQAVLHEDELTPHIHVYASCLVDGTLNFAKLYGMPSKLVKLQDRYALAMRQFGLKRGEKGSTVTHEDIQGMAKKVERLEKALEGVREALGPLSKHVVGLEGLKALKAVKARVEDGIGASGAEATGEASAPRRGPVAVCPEVPKMPLREPRALRC